MKDRDFDKLIAEKDKIIKQLKKEIQSLKKNLNKYEDVSDSINELRQLQDIHDLDNSKKREKELLSKKWTCFDCGKGVLTIQKFKIRDIIKYYRKCSLCDKHTKIQDYNDSVSGVEK